MRRIFGSQPWTARGVKFLLATRRYLAWSGGSITSRWRVVSSGGGGRSFVNTASRGAFSRRSGCLLSQTMSACFVTTQNGSTFSRSYQKSGACLRSQAHSRCG
jgi:hypothetical protein